MMKRPSSLDLFASSLSQLFDMISFSFALLLFYFPNYSFNFTSIGQTQNPQRQTPTITEILSAHLHNFFGHCSVKHIFSLIFQYITNLSIYKNTVLTFQIIMETLTRKHHNKRCNGITETIRTTLLKAQKDTDQQQFMNRLMNKSGASPKKCLGKDANQVVLSRNVMELDRKKADKHPLDFFKPNTRVSVEHHGQGILQASRPTLARVLSADKVSLRLNASRLARKGRKHTAALFANPPQPLSKKSTGYSTQSQQEVLREENKRFRGLCAAEAARLTQLEKQIENQQKMQQIRRQLYQQNIKKLKRVAGEHIFTSQLSDYDPESIMEPCEECDCLSITSK